MMTTTGMPAAIYRGQAREAVKFLIWAYTPFRPMNAIGIYDLVATNAFTARGLYLNLGYWKNARTIDEACEAMAGLVADTAAMGPGDEVVDVGFGFADQDMLWTARFAPRHIIGLNVTGSQVRIALERVRKRGMADRIELLERSATEMRLPAASCDIVTAVECAFHFETRERFFAEAFRVLRPGGRLVLADVIRAAPAGRRFPRAMQDLTWAKFAQKLAVPRANADRRDSYAEKLRASGFDEVCVTSISEHVFPGWHRAMREDSALMQRLPLAGRMLYQLLRRLDAKTVYAAFDYVLAAARKPL